MIESDIKNRIEYGFLNSNILKIIALICMTIDHTGSILFPGDLTFRIIGRFAFPIFAYLIAEGCRYTKNKPAYIGRLLVSGIIAQIIIYIFKRDMDYNIMFTFVLSIGIIFIIQKAVELKSLFLSVLVGVIIGLLFVLLMIVPLYNNGESIVSFDYGFFGILIPVGIYLVKNKYLKLGILVAGLLGITFTCELPVQIWSVLSVVPLYFYNGERGKVKLKYLFYIYYPLHLLVLFLFRIYI